MNREKLGVLLYGPRAMILALRTHGWSFSEIDALLGYGETHRKPSTGVLATAQWLKTPSKSLQSRSSPRVVFNELLALGVERADILPHLDHSVFQGFYRDDGDLHEEERLEIALIMANPKHGDQAARLAHIAHEYPEITAELAIRIVTEFASALSALAWHVYKRSAESVDLALADFNALFYGSPISLAMLDELLDHYQDSTAVEQKTEILIHNLAERFGASEPTVAALAPFWTSRYAGSRPSAH